MKTKTGLMTFKVKPEAYDEFQLVAELKGSNMSNLLHQYVTRCIWEEKQKHPDAFKMIVRVKDARHQTKILPTMLIYLRSINYRHP